MFLQHRQIAVRRSANYFTWRERSKNFQHFRSQRYIEDITWPRVDMNFIFECSTRYLTSERSERVRYRVEHERIKFISTSGHVIFCLLYKHRINSCEKGAIYYVAITRVISSRVKITYYLHVWRYEVFAGKLTWYFTGVYIIKPLLTSRCNAKGKISGVIKCSLIKASVFWTKYCYLCLVCCRPCLFFKKLFISVGRIKIINLRFCFIA